MTRRRTPAEAGPLPDPLSVAVAAYIIRFGTAPAVYEFLGRPLDLARELNAAVQRGDPLTTLETYRRLGIELPPADAGG